MSVFDVGVMNVLADDELVSTTEFGTISQVNIVVEGQSVTEVVTAGPQGPPGLQNVYIQTNDPSVEFNWGPEEEGFVWIQI